MSLPDGSHRHTDRHYIQCGLSSQSPDLRHNKCYRIWYRCLKNDVTQTGGNMTKNGRIEYTEVVRGRYLSATKKEKGKIW